MNESTEQLRAKLEQATASDLAEPIDDETAMLRESWLAFGKLVAATDAESKPLVTLPPKVRDTGVFFKFVAAIAASLLVGLAAWAVLSRESNFIEPLPEIAAPDDSSNTAPSISDVAEALEPDADDEDQFAWDDSFDEQLATASQAIRSAQADWSGGDRRYSVLLDQFEQFGEELSEGSL